MANILELGLFLAGMIWYLRRTIATGVVGKYYPIVFIALFVAVHFIGQTMPAPKSVPEFTVTALLSYTVFALLAAGLDKTRRQRKSP
ncbi:MAG: hypothetical protein EX271_09420 [Acidimicrobiales bacterium]|nr:hypothetical protein [Hyphomonadaceae bacterium]RZV40817.1 MAG: hypothetical protein EX271_09420 [Acidimicrobiales bacterium]